MNTEIKSDPGKQQVPAATGTASQPTDPEFTDAEQQGSGWAPNRSRRAIIIFGLVILAGVLTVLYAWGLPPFRSGNVTTDNAYVRGQTTIISPQVTGYVTAVNVRDFADVRKGAVLVTIDDRIYRARVAQGGSQHRRTDRNARQRLAEPAIGRGAGPVAGCRRRQCPGAAGPGAGGHGARGRPCQ